MQFKIRKASGSIVVEKQSISTKSEKYIILFENFSSTSLNKDNCCLDSGGVSSMLGFEEIKCKNIDFKILNKNKNKFESAYNFKKKYIQNSIISK